MRNTRVTASRPCGGPSPLASLARSLCLRPPTAKSWGPQLARGFSDSGNQSQVLFPESPGSLQPLGSGRSLYRTRATAKRFTFSAICLGALARESCAPDLDPGRGRPRARRRMGTAAWAPHARGGCCHSAVPKADDYDVFWGCFLPAGGGNGCGGSLPGARAGSLRGGRFRGCLRLGQCRPTLRRDRQPRVLIPWPSLIQTSPVPFRVVLLLWKFNDSPQAFASQT